MRFAPEKKRDIEKNIAASKKIVSYGVVYERGEGRVYAKKKKRKKKKLAPRRQS